MSPFENLTGRLPPQSMLQQRYLIVGPAGRGGMSAVYQGVDTRVGNRHIAIKEMSQGQLNTVELAAALTRFQQEASLLSSLNHPNLPRIYDAFSENGRSYLVMDYIDGKTLLQLVKESGGRPLPVAQVLDYARQLCDVLAYLHQHHPPIIFRDLKPTNVMVTENGHIYLIDFGIARFFKEGQAQDTAFLGSPGYAPPEQHGSSQTNPRSDLYSLGATLHFCLTGRDPFYATDRFSFPPARQLNPQLPIELDQLVQRLLALDEWQRPASALEVQQALLNIRQQAAEATTGFKPVTASAPTQYSSPTPGPSPAPVQPPIRSSNQAPAYSPTVPVRSAGSSPAPRVARTLQVGSLASLWTPGFIILFGLMLAVTVIGSIIGFNINQPYGPNNLAGLDHLVEAGLAVLLLIVIIAASSFARHALSLAILFLTGLVTLAASFAFIVETIRDIQQNPSSPFLAQVDSGQFATLGLVAASIISLCWLIRPYMLIDRVILAIMFGIALICALLQSSSIDTDVSKHILLLVTLILLIQGALLAAQMERVRKGR